MFVYSWPSQKALASIMAKIKAITRQGTNQPLSALLRQINPVLRGWTVYFRHGCSKQTFDYLSRYTWRRVVGWLRRKHRRAAWKSIRRRYLRAVSAHTLVPHDGGIALFNAASGTGHPVPLPRHEDREPVDHAADDGRDQRMTIGPVESRMRWKPHVRFGKRAGETDRR